VTVNQSSGEERDSCDSCDWEEGKKEGLILAKRRVL
jgi:hypothetical protein